jgi:MYXO-CTERM domain-containing protein
MKKMLLIAAALLVFQARRADAFCGFYVNGAGGEMFNDATQVVLMRMGTRTVLSMENSYQGPVEDFAMVVPVPVVLQEGDVKTLPKDVFSKVDVMGAPRLVEYWEQDPCAPEPVYDEMPMTATASAPKGAEEKESDKDLGVKVEAQFVVGEYQIVILSATDSTGLDTWLHQENYKIPDGAEPLLRPYVEEGSKFFVAKVDPKKVKFDADGHALLSPLRFHYDSEQFALPIRLGLAASPGKQDLIVSILSPEGRFNVSNYKNVTIPTNLDVKDEVRNKFAEFYAALYDKTLEKNPGAIVTEYSWDASTCDPCPGPNLDYNDFATLGADVLDKGQPYQGYQMVLTRLHARYGKDQVPDDLQFQTAPAIVGGREYVVDEKTGKLEEGAKEDSMNNFQGRYAIRHEWTGPIACKEPHRNRWGGPPSSEPYNGPQAGLDLAHAPRGKAELAKMVEKDVPEIGVKAAGAGASPPAAGGGSTTKPAPSGSEPNGAKAPHHNGCGCSSSGGGAGVGLIVVGVGLVLSRRRRSRV